MYYKFVEKIIRNARFKSVLEVGGDEYGSLCETLGKSYASCDIKTGLNAEDMPYEDDSFDLVFGQDTFHVMQNPEKAIPECVRVAKKEFWAIELTGTKGLKEKGRGETP